MTQLSYLSAFKAAIFDMDGLMLDTENHNFQCLNLACQKHGLEFPLDLYTKLIGRRTSKVPDSLRASAKLPLDEIIKQSVAIRSTDLKENSIRSLESMRS
jgi:beta-phosphoglucomutase-like phosphatase (HAD superfamily)